MAASRQRAIAVVALLLGSASASGPAGASGSGYRAAKRELLANGNGWVRSDPAGWVPASKVARRMRTSGGMRVRARGRARLVSIYVPESRGREKGFRVERLYGLAPSAGDPGRRQARDGTETAYATTVSELAAQHLARPTAGELHDRAVLTIASAPSAGDPIEIGRLAMEGAASGLDRWTRYQAPVQRAQSEAMLHGSPIQSVSTTVTQDRIAVVRLSIFSAGIARKVGDDLVAASPRAILLDLRGNPGGLLDEAMSLLRLLAARRGAVLAVERTRRGSGEKVTTWKAWGRGRFGHLPLLVLVDGKSASAAETVTASLKDSGRARIAGARTFGKALAQVPHRLEDGGSIRISYGRIDGPLTKWHETGIPVDLPEDALAIRGRRALDAGRDLDVAGPSSEAADPDLVLAGALEELRSTAAAHEAEPAPDGSFRRFLRSFGF